MATNFPHSVSTTTLDSNVANSSIYDSTEKILRPDHLSWRSRQDLNKLQKIQSNEKEENSCINFGNKAFQRKNVVKRLPILEWLPRYSTEDAVGDLIAGITVALANIPVALAFSTIAQLPAEAGLYSSFACNFVYLIFGSCRDNIHGSTAIASLLTYEATQGNWEKAIVFTFLTGIIEIILFGLLRLSYIINFVSGPVSAGFTSAVALIIFTSQLKDILVIKSSGSTFLQNWIAMFKDIHNYKGTDTLLGIGCVVLLLLLRYVGNLKVKKFGTETTTKIVNKIFWTLGVSRNALIVFVAALIVAFLESKGHSLFRLVGYLSEGFPEVKVPKFYFEEVVPINSTIVGNDVQLKTEGFIDLVQEFGINLLVVPLIALLETIAVCKTFANGKTVDSTQEVIAIGLSNVVNSFFQGYRVNGGLARGSINTASGGRTQMVNVYVGAIDILALVCFAKYFYYIPKAVLAAIILSAVLFQVQFQVIKPMWKSKRLDLLPFFIAFFACLVLPLILGIAIAIGVNLLFILYHSSRPKVVMECLQTPCGNTFLKLTPDRSLIFPSADFVRNLIQKSGIKFQHPVVIDCTYIYGTDFTTANSITSMVEDFQKRQQKIIFYNLKPSIVRVFEGVKTKLNICYSIEELEEALNSNIGNGISTISISRL